MLKQLTVPTGTTSPLTSHTCMHGYLSHQASWSGSWIYHMHAPQEKIYLIIFTTLWCRCLFTKFEHMCSDSLHMYISTHVHWYTYVLNLVNKQLHYSITYEQIYSFCCDVDSILYIHVVSCMHLWH